MPTASQAKCRACGRMMILDADGYLTSHGPGPAAVVCPGSGVIPKIVPGVIEPDGWLARQLSEVHG